MAEMSESALVSAMAAAGVPPGMWNGFVQFILRGRPGGHFLNAVLSNDLKEACNRADDQNKHRLYEMMCFLYNNAPMVCFGSPEKFENWCKIGGWEGFMKEALGEVPDHGGDDVSAKQAADGEGQD